LNRRKALTIAGAGLAGALLPAKISEASDAPKQPKTIRHSDIAIGQMVYRISLSSFYNDHFEPMVYLRIPREEYFKKFSYCSAGREDDVFVRCGDWNSDDHINWMSLGILRNPPFVLYPTFEDAKLGTIIKLRKRLESLENG